MMLFCGQAVLSDRSVAVGVISRPSEFARPAWFFSDTHINSIRNKIWS